MYCENGERASLPMQSIPEAGPTDLNGTSPTQGTLPSSPGHLNKRRKTGSAATRGVASLNPEQLAKKRANDREAQRAIRERTKTQIETLEKRIQELTSQQPYQELQAVIRQKEAIQAENDDIRRRLESVLSVIQPIVTAHGLTGRHASTPLCDRSR
jgi:TolA-binding protein